MFFTKLASKLHVSAVGQTDSKLDTVAVCSKEVGKMFNFFTFETFRAKSKVARRDVWFSIRRRMER